MPVERKQAYIALPEREDLVFEQDPWRSKHVLDPVMPREVKDYLARLLKPELEKFAQAGWQLDELVLHPWEPRIKPLVSWIPFSTVKFRCVGIIVHLVRETSSDSTA